MREERSLDGPPERPKAGGLLWLAGSLLILAAALCLFAPWLPNMPEPDLDGSWQLGMNQAVAQGLIFGRDMIFTFGPYAAIYTHTYHPATDSLILGAAAFLALSYGLAAALLLRRAGLARQALFLLATLALSYSADAMLLAYPLVAGVAARRLAMDDADGPWPRRAITPLLAVLFFAFGLLPLVKGSAMVLCVIVTGLVAIELLLARRLVPALAVALSPMAAILFFWSLADQPLTGLPSYFTSITPIISGYTEAMAIDGPREETALYLAAALALVVIVAIQERRRPRQAVGPILIVLAALFLSFKGGFVRHDGHAVLPAVTLILAGALLAAICRRGRAAVACVACGLVGVFIVVHHATMGPTGALVDAKTFYHSGWRELGAGRPDILRAEYRQALAHLAEISGFPKLVGSSDLYGSEQALLIGSGNRWNPRPILQSYSAYTPVLAEMNRRHLEGPAAPDNIFFRLEAIDGRLPTMDDGASWPALLTQYRVSGQANDYLILRRKPGAAPPALTPLASGKRRFGQTAPVPASNGPLFVKMSIKPSLAGRVAETLFKTTPLQITLNLKNGGAVTHRIVAGMTETGFLLSPLVASNEDLLLLYGDPSYLDGRQVVSMSIDAPLGHRLWTQTYKIEFLSLAAPQDPSLQPLFAFAPPFVPPGHMPVLPAAHCDGSIDLVDGLSPPPPRIRASKRIEVQGWLSPSTDRGETSDRALLVLTDAAGRHVFYPAKPQTRPDLAIVFQKPALEEAGFFVDAELSGLKGAYSLGLAYVKGGAIQLCPQFHLPMSAG